MHAKPRRGLHRGLDYLQCVPASGGCAWVLIRSAICRVQTRFIPYLLLGASTKPTRWLLLQGYAGRNDGQLVRSGASTMPMRWPLKPFKECEMHKTPVAHLLCRRAGH